MTTLKNTTGTKAVNISTDGTGTITAKANQSKRTFTIRKYIDGKLFAKYRTFEMSDDDFFAEEMNTENDWKAFLKSDYYYAV